LDFINPLEDAGWEHFVRPQPQALPFHSTAWAKVLHGTYGFQPRYLVVKNAQEKIIAGMPLTAVRSQRLVGLPFSDFCPPLAADSEVGELLAEATKEVVAGRTKSVELRGPTELDLGSLGFLKGPILFHHVIDLDGTIDEMFRRVHPSARRAIAKATKEGVTVRQAATLDDMRRFYLLNVKTRKKLGLIPQPWRFFEKIHEHMVSQGQGYLLLAEYDNRVIAGELLLAFNGTLVEKTSASDPRYLSLRANNLLKWTSIELGFSQGYRLFDLGRCEPQHEGLRRFKQLWGGEELPFYHYYHPSVQSGAPLADEAIWRRRLLSLAVRFMPLWALRQAGTLLYKRLA
jgi:lipid II:glycine glycyltransferase (peptidoglycan interpeptide bridge formation enzyme)